MAGLEEILGLIKVGDYYKRIESTLKNREEEEKRAVLLGFLQDNYYSAKERMDTENELNAVVSERNRTFALVSTR